MLLRREMHIACLRSIPLRAQGPPTPKSNPLVHGSGGNLSLIFLDFLETFNKTDHFLYVWMNTYMKVWMNIYVIYLPIHPSILCPVKFIHWDMHFYASSSLWDRRVPSPLNSLVWHFYSQALSKPQLLMCCLFYNVISMESWNIQSFGSGFFHLTKCTPSLPHSCMTPPFCNILA